MCSSILTVLLELLLLKHKLSFGRKMKHQSMLLYDTEYVFPATFSYLYIYFQMYFILPFHKNFQIWLNQTRSRHQTHVSVRNEQLMKTRYKLWAIIQHKWNLLAVSWQLHSYVDQWRVFSGRTDVITGNVWLCPLESTPAYK